MNSRFHWGNELRESVEGVRQPRLVGRRGVAMQDTLVDGVIDERHGRLQKGLCRGFILGFERSAELPDLVPQLGLVRPVQLGTGSRLLDAF